MIDKKQYQRTFGVLHASGDFLKEDIPMQATKHVSMRRIVFLCAAVILIFSMATVCYAKDIGGIQRTIQLWIHGDQTSAVMDIQNGQYTITYQDAEGNTRERGGGGVAINPDGSERPLTEEEMMEHLNMPEVAYKDDGSVWIYYRNQALEITDGFNAENICYVQLKNGTQTLYVTIRYQNGYAMSPNAFVQAEEFN